MTRVDWNKASLASAKEKLNLFSRMTVAYASGKYRAVPWKTMITVIAAIIYFLNPLDLIPDIIPIMGLTDDFGILIWVYNSLSTEIDKFRAWEKSITVV